MRRVRVTISPEGIKALAEAMKKISEVAEEVAAEATKALERADKRRQKRFEEFIKLMKKRGIKI